MSIETAIKKINNARKFFNDSIPLKRIALKMANELAEATPVDTGVARSNWYGEVNKVSNKFDKNKKDKAPSISKEILSDESQNINTIVISNNTPYIVRLNEGHSAQAPKSFIETTIKKVMKDSIKKISVDFTKRITK